jgi:hypothetical protein
MQPFQHPTTLSNLSTMVRTFEGGVYHPFLLAKSYAIFPPSFVNLNAFRRSPTMGTSS